MGEFSLSPKLSAAWQESEGRCPVFLCHPQISIPTGTRALTIDDPWFDREPMESMELFDTRCPETAGAETRTFTVLDEHPLLEKGHYAMQEYYCPVLDCDCRRVILMIRRLENGEPNDPQSLGLVIDPEAVLTFGWGSKQHYREWMGGDLTEEELEELVRVELESEFLYPHGPNADFWLQMVRHVFATNPDYVARLGKHYRMFRSVRPQKNGRSMRRVRRR